MAVLICHSGTGQNGGSEGTTEAQWQSVDLVTASCETEHHSEHGPTCGSNAESLAPLQTCGSPIYISPQVFWGCLKSTFPVWGSSDPHDHPARPSAWGILHYHSCQVSKCWTSPLFHEEWLGETAPSLREKVLNCIWNSRACRYFSKCEFLPTETDCLFAGGEWLPEWTCWSIIQMKKPHFSHSYPTALAAKPTGSSLSTLTPRDSTWSPGTRTRKKKWWENMLCLSSEHVLHDMTNSLYYPGRKLALWPWWPTWKTMSGFSLNEDGDSMCHGDSEAHRHNKWFPGNPHILHILNVSLRRSTLLPVICFLRDGRGRRSCEASWEMWVLCKTALPCSTGQKSMRESFFSTWEYLNTHNRCPGTQVTSLEL